MSAPRYPLVVRLSSLSGIIGDTILTAFMAGGAVWMAFYLLEAWFPAESLVGYDPDAHRQLGFYVVVRDAELGEQFLTVGREFPFEYDPSLWQMLELCDG